MAKKRTEKTPQALLPKRGEVIIRMYRQGLGDSFLLAFGTKKKIGPRFVLIDCGVHMREDKGAKRLLQVMENIATVTDNHLHVVVATHEHADHLSGFVQKGSPFLRDDLTIDELWVAWTEEIGDPQADRLRTKRGTARRVIDKAVKQARDKANSQPLGAAQLSQFADRLADIVGFEEIDSAAFDDKHENDVLNKISSLIQGTERGQMMQSFLHRFDSDRLGAASNRPPKPSSNELALGLLAAKANAVYCEPAKVLTLDSVDNVRAFVLGPPRHEKLLKKDRPSKVRGGGEHEFKETYLVGQAITQTFALSPSLNADEGLIERHADLQHPFAWSFRHKVKDDDGSPPAILDEETVAVREFISQYYERPEDSWRRIDGDWLGTAEELALHLDSDTNNTSLVLAFELGTVGSGQVLLFPGDAQVGNWLSWRDQDYSTAGHTSSADELIARTVLYKVGHHGSHNATLKSDPRDGSTANGVPYGLELMNDIIALIPVDRAAADKKMPTPWRMPHRPLYERLRERSKRRVLRSDERLAPLPPSDPADIRPNSTKWKAVPGKPGLRWRMATEKFKDGTVGPLFYDISIKID